MENLLRNSQLLLINMIFPFMSFGQDWSGVNSLNSPCTTPGLMYKYKLREESSPFKGANGKLKTHYINYRFINDFDKTICFSFATYVNGEKTGIWGRTCIKANSESSGGAYGSLESAKLPEVRVSDFAFKENGSLKEIKIECNESKKHFYTVNESGNSNQRKSYEANIRSSSNSPRFRISSNQKETNYFNYENSNLNTQRSELINSVSNLISNIAFPTPEYITPEQYTQRRENYLSKKANLVNKILKKFPNISSTEHMSFSLYYRGTNEYIKVNSDLWKKMWKLTWTFENVQNADIKSLARLIEYPGNGLKYMNSQLSTEEQLDIYRLVYSRIKEYNLYYTRMYGGSGGSHFYRNKFVVLDQIGELIKQSNGLNIKSYGKQIDDLKNKYINASCICINKTPNRPHVKKKSRQRDMAKYVNNSFLFSESEKKQLIDNPCKILKKGFKY